MFYLSDIKPKAKALIEATIRETETKSDRAYATGLIEMAYELKAITLNEQAAYKEALYRLELKK